MPYVHHKGASVFQGQDLGYTVACRVCCDLQVHGSEEGRDGDEKSTGSVVANELWPMECRVLESGQHCRVVSSQAKGTGLGFGIHEPASLYSLQLTRETVVRSKSQ